MNYKTLNLSGLQSTHDARGLKAMFEEFGEVQDISIAKDGRGSVTFTDTEHAKAAQKGLNGRDIGGSKLAISPDYAQRHAAPGTSMG